VKQEIEIGLSLWWVFWCIFGDF